MSASPSFADERASEVRLVVAAPVLPTDRPVSLAEVARKHRVSVRSLRRALLREQKKLDREAREAGRAPVVVIRRAEMLEQRSERQDRYRAVGRYEVPSLAVLYQVWPDLDRRVPDRDEVERLRGENRELRKDLVGVRARLRAGEERARAQDSLILALRDSIRRLESRVEEVESIQVALERSSRALG